MESLVRLHGTTTRKLDSICKLQPAPPAVVLLCALRTIRVAWSQTCAQWICHQLFHKRSRQDDAQGTANHVGEETSLRLQDQGTIVCAKPSKIKCTSSVTNSILGNVRRTVEAIEALWLQLYVGILHRRWWSLSTPSARLLWHTVGTNQDNEGFYPQSEKSKIDQKRHTVEFMSYFAWTSTTSKWPFCFTT